MLVSVVFFLCHFHDTLPRDSRGLVGFFLASFLTTDKSVPFPNLWPLPLHTQIHRNTSVAVAKVKVIYLWGWKLSE